MSHEKFTFELVHPSSSQSLENDTPLRTLRWRGLIERVAIACKHNDFELEPRKATFHREAIFVQIVFFNLRVFIKEQPQPEE